MGRIRTVVVASIAFTLVAHAQQAQPYFEFQVDKAVTEAANTMRPRYPDELMKAGVQGTVLAQFVVDTNGVAELETFKVLKSDHAQFSDAVRAALPAMRYNSAILHGQKVRQLVQQPFVFAVSGAAQPLPRMAPRPADPAADPRPPGFAASMPGRIAGPPPSGTVHGWSYSSRSTTDSGNGSAPRVMTTTTTSNGHVVRLETGSGGSYSLNDYEAKTMTSVYAGTAIEVRLPTIPGMLDGMSATAAPAGSRPKTDTRPGEPILGLRTTYRHSVYTTTLSREMADMVCSRPMAHDMQSWTTDDSGYVRVMRATSGATIAYGLTALPDAVKNAAARTVLPLRTITMEPWTGGTVTTTTEVTAFREGEFPAAMFAVPEGAKIMSQAEMRASVARMNPSFRPPSTDSMMKSIMDRAFAQMFDTSAAAGSMRATCVKKP